MPGSSARSNGPHRGRERAYAADAPRPTPMPAYAYAPRPTPAAHDKRHRRAGRSLKELWLLKDHCFMQGHGC